MLEMDARDIWRDQRVQLFYISIEELIVNANFDYESGAHDIQWLILIQSNQIHKSNLIINSVLIQSIHLKIF